MPTPSIYFCTPVYGGMPSIHYVLSMLKTTKLLEEHGIRHAFSTIPNDSLITRARNFGVSRMMSDPEGWTHLMFIDADIAWEPESVLRLLAADRDVIGGIYPLKKVPLSFPYNALEGRTVSDEKGLLKIRDAPTGFLLIKREVFTRLFAAHPELKCRFAETQTEADLEYSYALFDCLIRDGHYLSEDFAFSDRWRALGGEIWIAPEVRLKHIGPYAYEGCLADVLPKVRVEQ